MGNNQNFSKNLAKHCDESTGIESEQKPLQSGYLLKRGFKNFSSWKRRYCILLPNGWFSYYNSKQKIKGSVNFSNLNFTVNRDKKDANKFFILTSKRQWEFKAANKSEAQVWMNHIEKVINANSYSKDRKPSKSKIVRIKLMTPTRREFDSEDEDDDDTISVSNYKKRRSTAKSLYSCSNRIDFEYFKTNVAEALSEIVDIVQEREQNKKYEDGFDEVVKILSDDNKLKAIFDKMSKNKKIVSMKMYIATMALLQGPKEEVGKLAMQLVEDEDNELIDGLIQTHIRQAPSLTHSNTSRLNLQNFDDAQSMISTLSYFDDASSVMSELSMFGRSMHLKNTTLSKKYSAKSALSHQYSTKHSLFQTDGAFSILEETSLINDEDDDDKDLVFSELNLNDENDEKMHKLPSAQNIENEVTMTKYDDMQFEQEEDEFDDVQNENVSNFRVAAPQNPAVEVFGNFLSAFCGLCVPSLDVISNAEDAANYNVTKQFEANLDESGKGQTLLVYEALDGVTLAELKQQLEVVQISLHYKDENESNSDTTTQERIQRYFVSVVRRTFGLSLPHKFSHAGRSMIRDAGFCFAVDIFLFNMSRFPVSIPFSGKADGNALFISSDDDGDSALFGFCNRFMGGHDVTDMPYYLLNGGNMNEKDESIKLLISKQQQYIEKYLVSLQKFLSLLTDYYTQRISPNIQNGKYSNDPQMLMHATNPNDSKPNPIVSQCLLPIANFLYLHMGFELIIIDEYNKNPKSMATQNDKSVNEKDDENEKEVLRVLAMYRSKLIDDIMTLVLEGILIGITEISDLDFKDIGGIIKDIGELDAQMKGIKLINEQYLKLALRLFHSTAVTFGNSLNIEDSSSGFSENDFFSAEETLFSEDEKSD